MKNMRIITISAISLLLIGIFIALIVINIRHMDIGVYDPQEKYSHIKLDYELSYSSWSEDPEKIKSDAIKIAKSSRTPIMTIEPWATNGNSNDNILKDIILGKYDLIVENICGSLSQTKEHMILRLGHEMDIEGSRYPWSDKDPQEFANAYRHFVDTCKSQDKNSKISFMWSPSGEHDSNLYWPSDGYVDYIGLSVYSFDLWDIKNLGKRRSFLGVFLPKYLRVHSYEKPVIIAEMGVTGSKIYKEKWIKRAVYLMKLFPNLQGFIYFNAQDVQNAWGADLPTPDWRTDFIDKIHR